MINLVLIFFQFILIVCIVCPPAMANNSNKKMELKLGDGTKLTRKNLHNILINHRKWLFSEGKKGMRANFENAYFKGVDLTGEVFNRAKMSNVTIEDSIFNEAKFYLADLRGAKFVNTQLNNSMFIKTKLQNSGFDSCKINTSTFSQVDANSATFFACDLVEALLIWSDFNHAAFIKSKLHNSILGECSLEKTAFSSSELIGTMLMELNLEHTFFRNINFERAQLDLMRGKLPPVAMLSTCNNFLSISYTFTPNSLHELRSLARDAGLKTKERELTHAIMNNARTKTYGHFRSFLTNILFELPSGWGLYPGRPLVIMLCLIPFFAIPYLIALYKPGPAGIYRSWSADPVPNGTGKGGQIERLDANRSAVDINAIYFSILSAFHIGWRDLNVGTWITRVQPNEYTLRATGWVRTVSGIQSLISVYLLALAILTYFGRPFG